MKHTTTEGPLGFPMTDAQAKALEAVLAKHSKDSALAYRKSISAKGNSEVMEGERSDVSWISTEDPDHEQEVVLAKGMDDSNFKLNPIVTMNHAYYIPPVGLSVWRKKATDGALKGIKAKTIYTPKPASWPADETWGPDVAFGLVQSGLCRGKSVGFLPLSGYEPDPKTCEKLGWGDSVQFVIEEWLLLEYACTFLPVQAQAVVEAVSKSKIKVPDQFIKALGIQFPSEEPPQPREEPQQKKAEPEPEKMPAPPTVTRFTTLEEIHKHFEGRIKDTDFGRIIETSVQLSFGKARGEV